MLVTVEFHGEVLDAVIIMSSVVQEAADLMRQVQKLSKELNPVKTALLALKKRELATPNRKAAADSLVKILARVESVQEKYRPSLRRLRQLLDEELPELFVQTPLLTVPDEALDRAINALPPSHGAAEEDGAPAAPTPHAPPHPDHHHHHHHAHATSHHAMNEEGALLRELCPPAMPYVLQPENYRAAHEALGMRADVVEYLIATERPALARQVRRSYRLPRQWFPQLDSSSDDEEDEEESAHRDRADRSDTCHGAPNRTRESSCAAPIHRTGVSHVTHMTPVTLPAAVSCTASPAHAPVSSSSHPLCLPPAACDLAGAESTPPHTAAPGGSLSERVLGTLKSWSTRTRAVGGELDSPLSAAPPAATALPPSSSPQAAPRRPPRPALPNLVVRALCTALFLKDEYLDRMIIERVAEHRGYEGAKAQQERAALRRAWWCGSHADTSSQWAEAAAVVTARPSSGLGSSQRAEAARRQYEAELLARVQSLSPRHLCTQSSSALFDRAMMNLIEDIFTHTLRRCDKLRPELEERARRVSSLEGLLEWLNDGELDTAVGKRRSQPGNGDGVKAATRQRVGHRSGGKQQTDGAEESPTLDRAACKKYRAMMRAAGVTTAQTGRPSRLLSAEELLLAEEQWCNTVMSIKRPSRYYCMLTGECMNDTTEQASPIALPNGIIVSHRALMSQGKDEASGESATAGSAARHAASAAEGEEKKGGHADGTWLAERLAQIGAQYVFVT